MSDVHQSAGERLHACGQRYTDGRRGIVSALAAADGPLSITGVLEACAGLAQSSAYRNLAVLEAAGVVRRLVGRDDFARYELAEVLTEHHHHLICEHCGRVEDFTVPAALESDLERCVENIADRHGYSAVAHQLDLVGTCTPCRAD